MQLASQIRKSSEGQEMLQINPHLLKEFIGIAIEQAQERGLDVENDPTIRTAFAASITAALGAAFPEPLLSLVDSMDDADAAGSESDDAEALTECDTDEDAAEIIAELERELDIADEYASDLIDAADVLAGIVISKVLSKEQQEWAEKIARSGKLEAQWVRAQVVKELINLKLIDRDPDAEYEHDWQYDFTPAGSVLVSVMAGRLGIEMESDDSDDSDLDDSDDLDDSEGD